MSFAACYRPLLQQEGGFHCSVDYGLSKYFIDLNLIRGAKTRMQQYTRIEASMEIKAAGYNILYGNLQDILPGLARGTDNAYRKVKLPVVLMRKSGLVSKSKVITSRLRLTIRMK